MSDNVDEQYLDDPRWHGGPPICSYENLPAFETEAAVAEFRQKNGMDSLLGASTAILEKWRCQKCGCIHYIAAPPAPAGGSSGTTRAYVPPPPRYRREAGKL